MASEKKITIAFGHGGTIPASVLGAKEDKYCTAHEPVKVPDAYGRHLIDDRFAYEVTPSSKKADAEKARKAEADAEKAREAVSNAENAVAAAGDDLEEKAAANKQLQDAKAALANLQS